MDNRENSISSAADEYVLPGGMRVILRPERGEDRREVECLTREAFWKEETARIREGIGADEHYLAHLMRMAPEFVPEFDFVAEYDGRIVGSILYCKAFIKKKNGTERTVLTFGPISVLPEFQRMGIGGALIRHTFGLAADFGYDAVLIYGHPEYYPRFGFREASEYGITTPDGESFPAFMAKELIPGVLKDSAGSFHIPSVYNVDVRKAKEFDKQFTGKKA